tara:strand:+ start:31 stop:738 length:708 start_codon:yes stop_codon:yes gene_type:complete
MALPKLTTPEYTLTVPSTQEEIKYRAFLVKEQKVLMIAQESGDEKMIANALSSLVFDCTFGKVDATKNPMFDVEYIFLQIRAKSVGSEVDLAVYCPDDNETIVEVKVQLEDVQVQTNVEHTDTIVLTDDIKVTLRNPRLGDLQDLTDVASDFEKMTQLVKRCIDTVDTKDETINRVDMSADEIDEFIQSFSGKQLEDVLNFFETMPKVRHIVEVTNPITKVKGEVLLEGIESFLE